MFDFQLGRGRDGPAKFLKDWNGILQTDGYQAYDQVGGPGLVHVGCWAHARRKFVDAVKVNPKDGAAIADGHAHGRVVPGGSPCTPTAAERGGACCIAPRACAALGRGDSRGVSEAALALCCRRARWARP